MSIVTIQFSKMMGSQTGGAERQAFRMQWSTASAACWGKTDREKGPAEGDSLQTGVRLAEYGLWANSRPATDKDEPENKVKKMYNVYLE